MGNDIFCELKHDVETRTAKEVENLAFGYSSVSLDLDNFRNAKIAGLKHEDAAKWFLDHALREDDRIKWMGKAANAAFKCEEMFGVSFINDNSKNNFA